MKDIRIPRFTAEAALDVPHVRYRGGHSLVSGQNAVVPAIPACRNCDGILERCENNGWKPRAVCNACAVNNCYDDPPPPDPYDPGGGPPHWIFDKYWDVL